VGIDVAAIARFVAGGHALRVRPPRGYNARMTRALIAVAALALSLGTAQAGGDWNDKGIGWQPYDTGLQQAKKEKKPVLLVVYTEWCPHCTRYSGVFHDAKVVEKSKKFVMIRVDKDKQPEVSKQHAPDGEYIPRTYFLSSDGALDPTLHAPRDKFRYFYDESDPAGVLAGMEAALAKLK
jgi:thiol-disulfide isomerase/thioredoxin